MNAPALLPMGNTRIPMTPAEMRAELRAIEEELASNARTMRERLSDIEQRFHVAVDELERQMVNR